MKEILCNSVY